MFWTCFRKGFGYAFGIALGLSIAVIFVLAVGSAIAFHFSYGGFF